MTPIKRGCTIIAIVGAVAVISVGAIAGEASAATGASVDRATVGAAPTGMTKARPVERAPKASTFRKGCSLSCVKRALVSLIKKHNKLVKAFNSLQRDYYGCERVQAVTQYYGYDYAGGSTLTTALDFTATGDSPSAYVVTYVC